MEKICNVGNAEFSVLATLALNMPLNYALECQGDKVILSSEEDWPAFDDDKAGAFPNKRR